MIAPPDIYQFVLQIAGTIWLILGHIAGLYLAAFTMVVYVPYMISGAWLLLVAAHKSPSQ